MAILDPAQAYALRRGAWINDARRGGALTGVVFGIEEMTRSFEARASGLIAGAAILTGLTAQALLGDYTYSALRRSDWR